MTFIDLSLISLKVMLPSSQCPRSPPTLNPMSLYTSNSYNRQLNKSPLGMLLHNISSRVRRSEVAVIASATVAAVGGSEMEEGGRVGGRKWVLGWRWMLVFFWWDLWQRRVAAVVDIRGRGVGLRLEEVAASSGSCMRGGMGWMPREGDED
ncbi:hypothetical protein Tco_0683632 [Tanacetum coccineum]